ncbi:MAG: hypothetical protein R3E42_05135 [Burkholderiaceae bacterium]
MLLLGQRQGFMEEEQLARFDVLASPQPRLTGSATVGSAGRAGGEMGAGRRASSVAIGAEGRVGSALCCAGTDGRRTPGKAGDLLSLAGG